MEINVAQLAKGSVGSMRDCEVDGIFEVSGDSSLVKGKVRLMRTDRSILVKGTLHTRVKVSCSRCLSLFYSPLNLNIEEEYFPTSDVISGASLPVPEEPGCFTIDEHHILDLTEAIRQYALLAIPIKPLCHEDCTGLCPHCGHNLNHGPCNCLPQKADPRWAKLQELALASSILVNEHKGKE